MFIEIKGEKLINLSSIDLITVSGEERYYISFYKCSHKKDGQESKELMGTIHGFSSVDEAFTKIKDILSKCGLYCADVE